MKYFFLAYTLLVLSLSSNAMCSWDGIWCWPKTPTIKSNGIIMIEFYGGDQLWVKDLGTLNRVYLKAASESISLHVEEVCIGEYQLTQTILKPTRKLTSGTTYQLALDSNGKEVLVMHYNGEKYVPVSWKAVETTDKFLPEWNSVPKFINKTFDDYGCGPAKQVYFNVNYTDQSEVLIKATVKSFTTGKSSSYYLTAEKGQVVVGHGMCSGAFYFRDGKEYEVSFSLLDASGNHGCEVTKPIRFTRPEPDYNRR